MDQVSIVDVSTKLKNIKCVFCSNKFHTRGFQRKGCNVPLLLNCGHTCCEHCWISYAGAPCTLCNNVQDKAENNAVLQTNVYVVGLVNLLHSRPPQSIEPDVSFDRKNHLKQKQNLGGQGQCYECFVQADLSCSQCNVLYCYFCFKKMHQFRTLQGHTPAILPHSNRQSFLDVKKCLEHNELQNYYCVKCNVHGCHHCMLLNHQQHESIPQSVKNEEFMTEFLQTPDRLAETLQRVHQAQKKLRKLKLLPENLECSEIEIAVNQHFTRLHGVLQNVEKRMIDQIHEQRNVSVTNLRDIEERLKILEGLLQSALMMTTQIKDITGIMNLNDVIPNLNKLANSACYLVEDAKLDKQSTVFCPDPTIIEVLKNHCKLEISKEAGYKLVDAENLPSNYELEPLDSEQTTSLLNMSISSTSIIKPTSSYQSLAPRRSDNSALRRGGSCMVELCYINDPLDFYVRQMTNLSQFESMHNDLCNYATRCQDTPSDVHQGDNHLYMVRNAVSDEWYRGSIRGINTNDDSESTYEVFNVDHGSVEHNVPKYRMRDMPQRLMIKPMALHCRLYNILPVDGQWTNKATEAMILYPKPDRCVKMHVVDVNGSTYCVDLCKEPSRIEEQPVSLRESLIFMHLGTPDTHDRLLGATPEATLSYRREDLALETYHDVVVSHVETLHRIFVQKTRDHLLHLCELMKDMSEYYSNKLKSNDGLIYIPEIGIPCAVEKAENTWARGLISGLPGSRLVEVFLVDYGSKIVTSYEKIRRIHEKYIQTQAQAIEVSLKDLPERDELQGVGAINFLKKTLSFHLLQVFPYNKINNVYNVGLYKDGVNICVLLATSDFTDSTAELSRIISPVTFVQPRKVDSKKYNHRMKEWNSKFSSTCNASKKKSTDAKTTDPFKLPVKIIRAESPEVIYVANSEGEELYDELMVDIQKFYSRREKITASYDFKDESHFVIYSEADKAFCRCEILELKNVDEAEVFLYDLAFKETVRVSELKFLSEEFREIPRRALKIKLAGIIPCCGSATWTYSSSEHLKTLLLDKQNAKFYISQVDPVNTKDALIVDLWVEDVKIDGPLAPARTEMNCINQMLVDSGVALPIKHYKDKKTKVLAIDLKRQISRSDKDDITASLDQSPIGEVKEEHSNHEDDPSSDAGQQEYIEEKKLICWLPAEPIPADIFIAFPTYLDYDCCLYLHSVEHSKAILNSIAETLSMENMEVGIEPSNLVWEKGDPCIAQYHADKKWYRAVVRDILDNDMIEVEFIDYGSIEQCKNGTLKKQLALTHIPRQSTKCVIYGLYPNSPDGKWPVRELDMIHGLLVEKTCEITVLERKRDHLVVSVVLISFGRCELISYLINNLKMNVQIEPVETEESSGSNEEMSDTIGYSFHGVADEENISDCKICSTNDNQNGNQKHDDGEMGIKEEIEKMEAVIAGSENENAKDKIGQNNDDFDEESKECEPNKKLQSKIDEKTLIADDTDLSLNAEGKSYNVQDDIISSSRCFDGEAVDASCDNESFSVDSISLPDIIRLQNDRLVTSTPYNESFDDLTSPFTPLIIPQFEVQVLKAEIGSIKRSGFYMHVLDNKNSQTITEYCEEYEMIMKDMQEHAEEQPILTIFEQGTPCCTKYIDGKWYRSYVVSSHLDDTKYMMIKVKFVDFGNYDMARSDDIRTLKKEWFKAPSMSLWCPLWQVRTNPSVDDNEIRRKMLQVCANDAHEGIVKTRVFYVRIETKSCDFFLSTIYNDEACTELPYQTLIDNGFLQVIESTNGSKQL